MNINKANHRFKRWFILFLGSVTALIHFYLNVLMGKFDPMFTLNGLGYLALTAVYLKPFQFLAHYQKWIRVIFIIYTLLTIVLWVFLGRPYTVIGYIDKLVELILVFILVFDREK